MNRAHVLCLLMIGCADPTGLTKLDDGQPGTDTGTTDTTDTDDIDVPDACGDMEGESHNVDLKSECDISLQEGSFTPGVEYNYGTTSFCGPPAIGQIVDENGSGAIDVDDLPAIVLYQSGRVVALRGDNSGEYWTSQDANLGQDGGFAIGDLDNDGWPEVIAVNTQRVTALNGRNGRTMWTSPALTGHLDTFGYNYPSIADMDGDGNPEVTVGNTILNGEDGSIQGQGNQGMGAAPYGGGGGGGSYGTLSVPIDLDGDGEMELVTGNTAYQPNGRVKWSNNEPDGLVAVADFDLDGEGEIVVTNGIYVRGLETDGSLAWGPLTYTGNLGAPAVDDLDGDDRPDIVFAAQNSLVALAWGGNRMWAASISDSSGAAGPVLFDFEMDGYPEVLFADETSIRFFSGIDGRVKMQSNDHGSYTILETPVVADVDNDDQVEIVLGHCTWNRSLTVYGDANGTWPPGRKTWNQHGYSISNIGAQGVVPVGAANNWPDYNSFRSGDIGRPPGEWNDIIAEIVDVCEKECDEDTVYVAAMLGNAGNLEAPAGLPVSLRAGPGGAILATVYTADPIASGETSDTLLFTVSAADLGNKKPVVTADEDPSGNSMLYECDEVNNIAAWEDPVCR